MRWKFIAIQNFFKKQEKSLINNSIHHLKELRKEQTKSKATRKKQITKIREELNKLEILKFREKIKQEGLVL